MNRAPWDAAAAAAIGIDWIEHQLRAGGPLGRAALGAQAAFVAGDEPAAGAAMAAVMQAAQVDPARLGALRATLARCPDPAPAVARAASGESLDDVDLFELAQFLATLRALQGLYDPRLPAELLADQPEAAGAALARGTTAADTFYLDDCYDDELAAARAQASVAESAYELAHGRLAERVATLLGLPVRPQDEFILLRADWPGLPPAGVRVLREAATYRLCELAPDEAVLAAVDAREVAAARVAACEARVRAWLCAVVRADGAALRAAAAALGRLDALLARAQCVQRFGGCLPELVADTTWEIAGARNLPLATQLAEHGRIYVPLSLALEPVAVLTGPNMGGKTAALQTCGFIAACMAYGLPPPARRVRGPLFEAIRWIGLPEEAGPGQRPQLLSSFGREVSALEAALAHCGPRTLMLVDEFARTTSPREGRALTVALVHTLRNRGAAALIATHYAEVAEAAGVAHLAVGGLRTKLGLQPGEDVEAALRRLAEALDYRVEPARPHDEAQLDALALAELMGLDPALIARARTELRRAARGARL